MSKSAKIKIIALVSVLIISVGAMLAFGIALFIDQYNNRQGEDFYAHATAVLSINTVPRRPPPTASPPPANSGLENGDAIAGLDGYTATPKPFTPMLDFNAARQLYPDIVGWIQSEGTLIDYPIVQYTDNDFYLSRLPDRSRNALGSIYLDYRNPADFSGSHILIYGHNTATGTIFGSLKHYADQQYYERHPSVYIFTPHANYMVVLFAGYLLDSSVEHPPMHFNNEAEFDAYMADIRSRSTFRSNVEVAYGEPLVFLATCQESRTRASADWRRVIVGKLVKMDW
jgi:SrtB family sortase